MTEKLTPTGKVTGRPLADINPNPADGSHRLEVSDCAAFCSPLGETQGESISVEMGVKEGEVGVDRGVVGETDRAYAKPDVPVRL